jgi:hypothetical protein
MKRKIYKKVAYTYNTYEVWEVEAESDEEAVENLCSDFDNDTCKFIEEESPNIDYEFIQGSTIEYWDSNLTKLISKTKVE